MKGKKKKIWSTYNHLQVCEHWYSAVGLTKNQSHLWASNGGNSYRPKRQNGRNSFRLRQQKFWLNSVRNVCAVVAFETDSKPTYPNSVRSSDLKVLVNFSLLNFIPWMNTHFESQILVERSQRLKRDWVHYLDNVKTVYNWKHWQIFQMSTAVIPSRSIVGCHT